MQLFSENAVSETIAEEKTILKLEGRKKMAQAFEKFVQDKETVYHFNDQQVVTVDGDNIQTTTGATYEDDYIPENNERLVAKRVGTIEWRDKLKSNPKMYIMFTNRSAMEIRQHFFYACRLIWRTTRM